MNDQEEVDSVKGQEKAKKYLDLNISTPLSIKSTPMTQIKDSRNNQQSLKKGKEI